MLARIVYSACALIASKFEDRSPPSVNDFVFISDYSFTTAKLRSLEERVCKELSFGLHRVTPFHFVNLFLRASHACASRSCQFEHMPLREMVLYLLELSRLSHDLSLCRPSLLTASAVYLARATVGVREQGRTSTSEVKSCGAAGFWSPTLEYYTGYSTQDLKETILIIHRYQMFASTAEHTKGPYMKYKTSTSFYVSAKPAVCSCDQRKLRYIAIIQSLT